MQPRLRIKLKTISSLDTLLKMDCASYKYP